MYVAAMENGPMLELKRTVMSQIEGSQLPQIVYSSKLPKSSVYMVTPCVCEF